jgi:hypothetical protein
MKKVFYIAIFVFLFLSLATFKLVRAATCDGICDLKCTASGCALTSWERVSNTKCTRKMCMKDCSGKAGCCGSWIQSKSCPIATATRAPTTVISGTSTPISGTVVPTISGTIAPTSATCTKKSKGDANCDNSITLTDFEIWRSEFIKNALTKADFNDDRKINLFDFEIWRGNLGG